MVWNWTRKRFGESPVNWGLKCWRPAPVTCYGSVPGNCPRGTNSPTRGSRSGLMVAGFGVRTVVENIRVSGKMKRKKFRIESREPKVVILFETDEKGRMVKGSRPVIDGTLQSQDALTELLALHLQRLGAAKAKLVTVAADSAWISAPLDWVTAQVKLDPARVAQLLDRCHGVHHLSQASAALDLAQDLRTEQ